MWGKLAGVLREHRDDLRAVHRQARRTPAQNKHIWALVAQNFGGDRDYLDEILRQNFPKAQRKGRDGRFAPSTKELSIKEASRLDRHVEAHEQWRQAMETTGMTRIDGIPDRPSCRPAKVADREHGIMPSLQDQPTELTPNPLGVKRNFSCQHYEDCLDRAVKESWAGFSCEACSLRNEAEGMAPPADARNYFSPKDSNIAGDQAGCSKEKGDKDIWTTIVELMER